MATDISYLAVANTVCERCSVKDNRCFVVKAAIRNVNGSTNQLEYSCHLYKQDSRFPSVKMRLLIADIAQTEIEMSPAIDGPMHQGTEKNKHKFSLHAYLSVMSWTLFVLIENLLNPILLQTAHLLSPKGYLLAAK